MKTVNESLEMMNEMGAKGYETARELGEINLRAMESVVQRQMDSVGAMMEMGMRQFTAMSEAKGYNDVIKGQVALTRDMGEKVMEMARDNVRLANDTRDQYRAWFERGMESAAENMKRQQSAV